MNCNGAARTRMIATGEAAGAVGTSPAPSGDDDRSTGFFGDTSDGWRAPGDREGLGGPGGR